MWSCMKFKSLNRHCFFKTLRFVTRFCMGVSAIGLNGRPIGPKTPLAEASSGAQGREPCASVQVGPCTRSTARWALPRNASLDTAARSKRPGAIHTSACWDQGCFQNNPRHLAGKLAELLVDCGYLLTHKSNYCLHLNGPPNGPRPSAGKSEGLRKFMCRDANVGAGWGEHSAAQPSQLASPLTQARPIPHPIIAATALLKCIKQPEAKTPINSSVKAEMFFSNGSLSSNNHSSLMCTWLWLTFFWHFLTSPSQVLIWN